MGCLSALWSLMLLLSTSQVYGDPEACSPETRPKILTDPTGTFNSLNFPSNYPDETECSWLIVAQPNEVVNVDFTSFDTERRFDKVWFHDGNSTGYPVILGLDGTYNPAPTTVASSQQFMFISFISDAFTNAGGFSANYGSVDPAGIQSACAAVSRPLVLTEYSGVFTSSYYPDPYPLQCECAWLIVSQEPNGRVLLDFTFFYTEGNNDWVVIHDGASVSDEIIFRLSGLNQPAPTGITSSQSNMLVRFASDANLSFRGFRATYSSLAAANV